VKTQTSRRKFYDKSFNTHNDFNSFCFSFHFFYSDRNYKEKYFTNNSFIIISKYICWKFLLPGIYAASKATSEIKQAINQAKQKLKPRDGIEIIMHCSESLMMSA
jgi:hypothetical protein